MNNIVNQLLHISLVSSGMILVLLVANYYFAKKYSLKWMQMLWFFILLRLLLPSNLFTISIPVQYKEQKAEHILSEEQMSVKNELYDSPQQEGFVNDALTVKNKELPLGTYEDIAVKSAVRARSFIEVLRDSLAIFWLLGVVFLGIRYIVIYYLMRSRIMRYNETIVESEFLAMQHIFENKGYKANVYKNTRVRAPFSFGIIHKAIILPEKEYTTDELKMILCHEYTHISNHDIEFKMLLCLVKIIHWFNPFVYLMERTINQNMELICDEEVIREQNLEYRKMYGMAILNTIKDLNGQSMFIGATHFEGEKKQIKERFKNIMKPSNSRKKPIVLTTLVILILATSLITCKAVSSGKDNITEVKSNVSNVLVAKDTKLEPITILATGYENFNGEEIKRADSILLLTWKPDTHQLAIQSLCRDMLVSIPGKEDNKINAAYYIGGSSLLKETVEQNFGVKINYVATVDYKQFKNVIDKIGGVEINISEQEAKYLSETNYISQKSNRTLKPGLNLLNGDQALGYARIRYVSTADGTQNDFGRVKRQRWIAEAVLNKCREQSMLENLALAKEITKSIETDMPLDQILTYAKDLLSDEFILKTGTIPVDGSFQSERVNGKSVLKWDKEINCRALE